MIAGVPQLAQRTNRCGPLGAAGAAAAARGATCFRSAAAAPPIRARPARCRGASADRRTPRPAPATGERRVLGHGPQGLAEQLLGQRVPGPGVHADGQVGADPAEGRGGVQEPARQVEAVARCSTASISGGSRPAAHGGPPVVPRLVAQRRLEHRRMDLPALLALDLQHEHVVDVVVIAESLVLRRRDVRVGLHGMAELGRQLLAQPMIGGHTRCRPCSTMVEPSANSRTSLSSLT